MDILFVCPAAILPAARSAGFKPAGRTGYKPLFRGKFYESNELSR